MASLLGGAYSDSDSDSEDEAAASTTVQTIPPEGQPSVVQGPQIVVPQSSPTQATDPTDRKKKKKNKKKKKHKKSKKKTKVSVLPSASALLSNISHAALGLAASSDEVTCHASQVVFSRTVQ